ncbi:MAG: glucoamylase family protein, partial [Burkholderiaceae bacterium]
MFAGQCGLDPYSSDASDLYQDLFGLGTFTGKGLLNVAAVHAVLDRRLPDGAVLSHDLLEGSIARCGYASDVIVMEDQPHHAGVAASRVHRWTRGDWQLIPFLYRANYFGIDALGVWRMLDNLRRSLIPPVSLLLLVWVVFTASIPIMTAISIVFCAYWVGPGVGALAGLIPARRGIAWVHFFDVGIRDLLRSVGAALWQLSQLLVQARLMFDAIARAVWRMVVSRKKLLEWTTAAQAQAAAKYTLQAFVRSHATTAMLGLVLAAVAVLSPHPWLGMGFFLIWAAAPLTAYWASKPADHRINYKLEEDDRAYLLALARQTWHFFETTVGAEDHYLPPDNLQMDPEPTIAHRTSPTNIGLYLLAVASAREFGWISTDDLIARLEATLDTVEQLPKNDGHLFNWYETRSLEVLTPAYVSTVDSGNLAGHLLTLAQACRQFAHHGTSHQTEETRSVQAVSLQNIVERCTRLFQDMNFSGLYSAKRHLFHIGLRVHEKILDKSYYDLIASESRLTSFLAIAKGDVPRRHWAALGRSFLTVGVTPGLKSWSGSMFEYLMPSLIMTEPDQGLLHVSGHAAVMEQQAFGRSEQLPWGVSESAHFAQDHTLAYQYGPFGVPRLALRRTPILDRVVAPYASVMASMFMPQQAVANLKKLALLGARGKFGFIDALDFTVSRQADAQVFSLVNTFMAHHQGMSLVALCNVLCDEAPRRWFASAPLVQAFDSLLHEKTPRQIIETADPRALSESQSQEPTKLYQARDIDPQATGQQPTQLLSNGCYSVVLRANGAGVSRWHGHNSTYNISRWRDDLLRDQYGSFIYVRADKDVHLSSVTYHPAPHPDWQYKATFLADRVLYQATSKKLEINTTVLVSPEDDTELRMVTLQNLSPVEMNLEVISCFEAVLADARADEAHPAFSNLFLQTDWLPQWRAMMLTRKPRLQGDSTLAVAHFLAESDANVGVIDFVSDRRSFSGRGRTVAQPLVQVEARMADGSPVNGLDPIAGLRVQVRIPAGAIAHLSFATAAAGDANDLALRIDKYLQPMHVKRAKRMAATLAQVRIRDLGLAPEENAALQDLNTALIYTSGRPMTERTSIDLRQLWRFGLSGDKPIILVKIHSSHGLGLVHTLLRAQPWWSFCGLAVDLVILNSEVNSYLMPLQRDILNLRDRTIQQSMHSFPRRDIAGFYLLSENEVSPSERATLSVLARIVLVADGRPLAQQIYSQRDAVKNQPGKESTVTPFLTSSLNMSSSQAGMLREPQGVFEPSTGEFQFHVDASQRPLRPWVNVISNASFGCQVSEAGSGYTWAVNSRLQQLTPWSNDPVQDPGFEHFVLQDRVTHELLALTPSTESGSVQPFRVRHGQGYSVFECMHGQLGVETTFFVDALDSVKFIQVQLHNTGTRKRHLRAHGMVEWQMGTARIDRRTLSVWKSKGMPVLYA